MSKQAEVRFTERKIYQQIFKIMPEGANLMLEKGKSMPEGARFKFQKVKVCRSGQKITL